MKKIIFVILILLLTGCGDYRELSDMAIVSSIGLDHIDDEYQLTVQILDSKGGTNNQESSNSSPPQIVVYTSSGKTIHEALRNTVLESPKKLYVGHIETVIISESAAKENITEFFDFFLRDAEASKGFNIILAKDCKTNEIMDILTPLDTIPGENISSSIENAASVQGSIVDVPFDIFVSNVVETGIDAVIPVITIVEEASDNIEINPNKRLTLVNKIGIFDDYKFLKYISENATIGYNLIKEGLSSSIIPFKCDKENYASIELIENKTDFEYDIKSQTIKVKSKIKGALSELNCNVDISKEENVNKLENEIKNEIKNIMNETVLEAKNNSTSDFLGIGQSIYKNNYKYYKKNENNIEDIIKNMKSDIKIEVSFIQKGSIKEGEEKY